MAGLGARLRLILTELYCGTLFRAPPLAINISEGARGGLTRMAKQGAQVGPFVLSFPSGSLVFSDKANGNAIHIRSLASRSGQVRFRGRRLEAMGGMLLADRHCMMQSPSSLRVHALIAHRVPGRISDPPWASSVFLGSTNQENEKKTGQFFFPFGVCGIREEKEFAGTTRQGHTLFALPVLLPRVNLHCSCSFGMPIFWDRDSGTTAAASAAAVG